MRLKMIDWLGMFDVFFSTFSSTKAVVEPLPEEKKKKPEKTVVIQREVASRKAELKKKREQSHNRDYEIERNR